MSTPFSTAYVSAGFIINGCLRLGLAFCTGRIPKELGNVTMLEQLNLGDKKLTGRSACDI